MRVCAQVGGGKREGAVQSWKGPGSPGGDGASHCQTAEGLESKSRGQDHPNRTGEDSEEEGCVR